MFQAVKHLFRANYAGKPTLWTKAMGSFYELAAKDIDMKDCDFKQFQGKVILVTNVACECGYTDGAYKAMTKMYNEKKDKGFVVMAFPCNQFGGQEPENEEAIKHIVTSKYKVNFNLFAKIDVNGPNTHPVYKFLKTCFPGDITWNFSSKFLINRDGVPIARFEKEPWSEISAAIDELLEAPASSSSSAAPSASSAKI